SVSICTYRILCDFLFFFFHPTASSQIYTLSLHDALPISSTAAAPCNFGIVATGRRKATRLPPKPSSTETSNFAWTAHDCTAVGRSEEHTSELQSPCNLVCRLLLEKKKKNNTRIIINKHNN